MNGQWIKRGRIFAPGRAAWSRHYGLAPTPTVSSRKGRIRIYFLTAGDDFFGRVAFLEVDSEDLSRVVYEHPEPVLDLGNTALLTTAASPPPAFSTTVNKNCSTRSAFNAAKKHRFRFSPDSRGGKMTGRDLFAFRARRFCRARRPARLCRALRAF